MKSSFKFLLIAILMVSCAPPSLYYWGDYPNTLYKYRKNTDDSSLTKHVEELEKIINISKRRNIKVAPGLQAELGYHYLMMNKLDEARAMFDLERVVYPESSVLMGKMIEKIERMEP